MSESSVFIPWMHEVDEDYYSEGVWVTASEVRDVLTTSHMHCGWEVSRGGEAQPCAKTAVAIRYDEENGVLGEVCKAHAVRVLVPLAFIAQVAAECCRFPKSCSATVYDDDRVTDADLEPVTDREVGRS